MSSWARLRPRLGNELEGLFERASRVSHRSWVLQNANQGGPDPPNRSIQGTTFWAFRSRGRGVGNFVRNGVLVDIRINELDRRQGQSAIAGSEASLLSAPGVSCVFALVTVIRTCHEKWILCRSHTRSPPMRRVAPGRVAKAFATSVAQTATKPSKAASDRTPTAWYRHQPISLHALMLGGDRAGADSYRRVGADMANGVGSAG